MLVIIGLLIGGILVGQSLIESSKLNGFVKQITQLDIAATNFKLKYNQIPGDSNLMTLKGNNDRLVKDSYSNDDYLQGEIGFAWVHLSEAGMLQDQYSRIATNGTTVEYGVHVPKINYGEIDGGVVIGTPLNGPDPWYNNNVMWISHFPESTNYTWGGACSGCGYVFTTAQAFAADKKMDDGLPREGIARAASTSEFGTAGVSCINGSDEYYLDSATPRSCNMIVKLFSLGGGE